MCLKRNKLEQKPTAEWMDPRGEWHPDWLRDEPFEPIERWQQGDREIKHKAYRQLCDYYNTGGKKLIHTCAHTLRHAWLRRQSLDVTPYLPAVPPVPMTTEWQADKVTFSSWGSVIARPRHVTERDRDGGEMRANIKLWGEELKEIWPTVIEDTTRVKFNLRDAQVRLMLGVCWC